MSWWHRVLLVLFALTLLVGGYVLYEVRKIDVETLSPDLHVLRGLGGNVAVLKTAAGTVVVDSMTLPLQGSRIRAIARELTGMDTVLLINTHYHLDHTHGNPAFEPGIRVLATERTRSHLQALDAEFWQGDSARLLPNETFTDQQELNIGGKRLLLVHPGAGHTDGDLVVVFTDEGVIHMGDLLFNGHYPNIDLEAGGTVSRWPATLARVQQLPFTRVIPGHGPTSGPEVIDQFSAFLTQLAAIGARAAAQGTALETMVSSPELTADAGYEPIRLIIPIGLDRPFVLRRAWEEATGNFELLNPVE
ncbi:MAG: MBL fold metallo-hydrolase [Pseudomonadales bacterium]